MDIEKINKNLQILQNVADKLIGGQLHTGNVAHDAPTKGYTIQNCVNNIRKAFEKTMKEEINEEELDSFAEESCDESGWGDSDNSLDSYIDGFKAGYRKAKDVKCPWDN